MSVIGFDFQSRLVGWLGFSRGGKIEATRSRARGYLVGDGQILNNTHALTCASSVQIENYDDLDEVWTVFSGSLPLSSLSLTARSGVTEASEGGRN